MSATPDLAAADSRLDRRLVRGVAWTALARWASQLAVWGATLVAARLLASAWDPRSPSHRGRGHRTWLGPVVRRCSGRLRRAAAD